MAHLEMQNFCKDVKALHPEYFDGTKVLDIGSLDINGNNRVLFDGEVEYTGLDIAEGKNVDVISLAHEFKSKHKYDVVCSTECLEHDIHWQKTLKKMLQLTRKGGLMFLTCATTGRIEHGTINAYPDTSPNTIAKGGEWATYYKNLTKNEIDEVLQAAKNFKEFDYIINGQANDLYFWGVKK